MGVGWVGLRKEEEWTMDSTGKGLVTNAVQVCLKQVIKYVNCVYVNAYQLY